MRFLFLFMFSFQILALSRTPISPCEQACPVYFRFQLQCASDGKLYTDLCRAQCVNKNNKILFDCGLRPNRIECQKKCTKQVQNTPCPKSQCLSKCKKYFAPQAICASDRKLYMDLCRAKCVSPSLTQLFKCPYPLNNKKCALDCKNYNRKPAKKCSDSGFVCSYEGRVFDNECDLMNCSTDELRYRCAENGVWGYLSCKWICYQFKFNRNLKNCFDNDNEYACFEDGLVRKDRCVPRAYNFKMKFVCKKNLHTCVKKCLHQHQIF